MAWLHELRGPWRRRERAQPTCPTCRVEGAAARVIYLGFPMKYCPNGACGGTIWGIWSWLPRLVQVENGGWSFMLYRDHYLPALWRWLTDDEPDAPT